MNRTLVFGIAMFFAIVGLSLWAAKSRLRLVCSVITVAAVAIVVAPRLVMVATAVARLWWLPRRKRCHGLLARSLPRP